MGREEVERVGLHVSPRGQGWYNCARPLHLHWNDVLVVLVAAGDDEEEGGGGGGGGGRKGKKKRAQKQVLLTFG